VLEELATDEMYRGMKLGLASRTDCVQDAHALMELIHVTEGLKVCVCVCVCMWCMCVCKVCPELSSCA
jgi:hypothetical protein